MSYSFFFVSYFNYVVHKYCLRYKLFVFKYCNIYLSCRFFYFCCLVGPRPIGGLPLSRGPTAILFLLQAMGMCIALSFLAFASQLPTCMQAPHDVVFLKACRSTCNSPTRGLLQTPAHPHAKRRLSCTCTSWLAADHTHACKAPPTPMSFLLQ